MDLETIGIVINHIGKYVGNMNQSKLIKRILIIDDDKNTRSLIENLLKESISEYKLNFVVLSGINTSAMEALRRANGDIDLISTDINHPGESGIELIKVCKEKYPHIPIVVCSGNATRQDLKYMQENGLIERYFKKPFNVNVYVQSVKKILQSQKVIRPVF